MRVLILDFDFFSALGGGQTFYRRVVERHPDWEFHYPSRGFDLKQPVRSTLPANAKPFGFNRHLVLDEVIHASRPGPNEAGYVKLVAQVAVALQGRAFDLVEVPAFFPIAHKVRPIFAAHGIVVRRISLGMLGWLSVGVRNSYSGEIPEQDIINQEEMERRCVSATDVPYSISDLHTTENAGFGRSVATIDMHDALENFGVPSPEAPGEGPPDLWYVGRLDRNKGPDIFIELAARLPRHLYRGVYLTGPDNPWTASLRWSEEVLALAQERGVNAEYLGELSKEDLQTRVYKGRSVVVIPSRSDAFNYVALEALLNGVPTLLSRQAGAAGFLQRRHPHIAPPIMDPQDLEGAAAQLRELLEAYPAPALELRRSLRETPWPKPQDGFLQTVLSDAGMAQGSTDLAATEAVTALNPLSMPAAISWRSAVTGSSAQDLSVVLLASADLRQMALSLGSLASAPGVSLRVLVVDDGGAHPNALRQLVRSFLPEAAVLRQGPRGFGAALLRGLQAVETSFVSILEAGQGLDPERVLRFVQTMSSAPEVGAVVGAWQELDAAGTPVLEHAPDPMTTRALLLRDQLTPGPGAVISRGAITRAGGVDVSWGEHSLTDLWVRLDDSTDITGSPEIAGWVWPRPDRPKAPPSGVETLEQQLRRRRRIAEQEAWAFDVTSEHLLSDALGPQTESI